VYRQRFFERARLQGTPASAVFRLLGQNRATVVVVEGGLSRLGPNFRSSNIIMKQALIRG
jgi:hypothetical protein